jgi:tetratricopeptide (TPR) repeat protein
MTDPINSEEEKSKSNSSNTNETKGPIVIPIELGDDFDYKRLLEYFQNGEFAKAREKLIELEQRYPDNPKLQNIKTNLQMKLSVKDMEVSTKKAETRKKVGATLKLTALFVFGTLFVLIVFMISYYLLNSRVYTQQSQVKSGQLTSLNAQAEQLLDVGNPQAAADIVDTMREIDPAYENLEALSTEVNTLLALESKYQEALDLRAEGNNIAALALFREVEEAEPGMWDVSQQIVLIETSEQITTYLDEGNAAYQEQNWGAVINAYEGALILDPKLDDPQLKEQLLKGYLNEIIRMLQNDTVTIEEVETAEGYYRKAVALIPQSREFATEREDLQEVSSNLLQLKFGQTAKDMLNNPNQTVSSISKAVSYLNKAANIDQTNSALQKDVKNAELYQIGFQDFTNSDWIRAITNLSQLVDSDAGFANGNAQVLLYESYYELGSQYFSAGFYQDAINNLEQAEIVAWDGGNKLQLFQVQMLLGDTFIKTNDVANAVSYYVYALTAIDIEDKLASRPNQAALFTQASYWATIGSNAEAYTAISELLEDLDFIYTNTEVEIGDGVCLALFAAAHSSTVNAIINANDLPNNMVIKIKRSLIVPSID